MSWRNFIADCAALLLAWPVAHYIRRQRNRIESLGRPLPADAKNLLAPYFEMSELASVRIVVADPLPIRQPPLGKLARRLGLDFLTLEQVGAITFDHVIACRERPDAALLFHELVHVVQYRLLGVIGFARWYVRGFLGAGCYYAIPLEQCAFELEGAFRAGGGGFDVTLAVRRWIYGKNHLANDEAVNAGMSPGKGA